MFKFSDDKSVVALNRTAENRENQSMETQNWKQYRRLPRQAFLPSNYDDDAFQKENAFPRQKVVASTNLSQMIRRKTKDLCGKDVLKKKNFRFKSFIFSKIELSSWIFLIPPTLQVVIF